MTSYQQCGKRLQLLLCTKRRQKSAIIIDQLVLPQWLLKYLRQLPKMNWCSILKVKISYPSVPFITYCVTHLLQALKNWSSLVTQLILCIWTCIGLFDCVPHRRLLTKLQSYGIEGKLLDWIEGFLGDRKQNIHKRFLFWLGQYY